MTTAAQATDGPFNMDQKEKTQQSNDNIEEESCNSNNERAANKLSNNLTFRYSRLPK